jgi:GNAT superfamily N-acetyltransferase
MSLPEGFTVRRADVTDIDMLVAQRHAMFRDVHQSEEALLNSMSANFRAWALQHMNAGDYLAWLAEARDGTIAAGAALWMMDWPPHVIGKSSRRGNIVNVYTRDKFRRLGLARQMMETVPARLGVVSTSRWDSNPPTRCVCSSNPGCPGSRDFRDLGFFVTR